MSSFKREVKRAKLFEVQRLVRRMKQLSNKKGSEAQLQKNRRKVERFEKELEFMKDATADEISRAISRKGGGDVCQDDPVIDEENPKESDEASDGNERNPKESDETSDGNEQNPKESDETSDGNVDLHKRAIDRIVNSKKLQAFLKRESQDSSNDLVEGIAAKKEHKPLSKTRTSKTKPTLTDKDISPRKRKRDSPVHLQHDLQVSDEEDSFLLGSSSNNSDSELEGIDSKVLLGKNRKGAESCFVQTLSGSKAGESNKRKLGKGKEKNNEKKAKKNRMGQRARQKMNEKIHGKSAKHLQKNKPGSEKESEAVKMSSEVKATHTQKQSDEVEVLHPSWEATRKRRLQETAKVEFKGQKIKFDDSE